MVDEPRRLVRGERNTILPQMPANEPIGYTGIGPATEPEPVQLPAGKEWKRTIIVNDDALSPVGQEQVDYRDAEIAKLRAAAARFDAAHDIGDALVKALHEVDRLRAELDEARRRIAAALALTDEPFVISEILRFVLTAPRGATAVANDDCRCFLFEDDGNRATTCVCGHEIDEHDDFGECQAVIVEGGDSGG